MKQSLIIILKFLIFFSTAFANAFNDVKEQCSGKGSLVYLIGGGPAFSTWNLKPIQNQFNKEYKICRWDMRGVGEHLGLSISSQKPALSQWIADMDEVLPQQPVVLWGHSWGALQVLLFAKNHPERVSKLILSNPVDPSLLSMEHIERKLFSHPEIDSRLTLEEIGNPAEELHNFRSKISSYFADAEQGWEYASRFSRQDSNNHLNIRIWDEYKKNPLTDKDVKRLTNKIAGLIHCRDDVLQPESLSEYRRLLDSSKHHILTGCAHFPWEENPADYYRVLSGLLDK